VLEGSRFVARQVYRFFSRRLPEITQRPEFALVSDILETLFGQMIEQTHQGLFQGAACSQPTDLPPD